MLPITADYLFSYIIENSCTLHTTHCVVTVVIVLFSSGIAYLGICRGKRKTKAQRIMFVVTMISKCQAQSAVLLIALQMWFMEYHWTTTCLPVTSPGFFLGSLCLPAFLCPFLTFLCEIIESSLCKAMMALQKINSQWQFLVRSQKNFSDRKKNNEY